MGDVVDLRPEELRAATIKRRLVTVPVVYLMFIVVTALIVPLLVGAFIWDLAMLALKRRPPSATRLILILWGLLIADAIGIVALLITWITAGFGTNRQRLGATAFKIQSVWANWMYGCAKHSFRLNFDVQGREDCAEGPYILLVRHSSMVDNLIMPVVGVILPGNNGYEKWAITIGEKTIPYGKFLGDIVSFLILALALFIFIVKFLGWVMQSKAAEPDAPPAPTVDQELLTEIRDLLKQQAR